jgi:hypothetical protein
MSDITLVRCHDIEVTEAEKAAARKVLFGHIDGLGDRGRKQWRRLLNSLFHMEPGEMVEIRTHKERSGPFHRRHMALEQRVFEAQEKFDQFEAFRTWLKVGSGFVDWHPGPKGGVIPVPRSISYARLEDDEMRQVHDDMVAFLRTEHAGRTLWRHLETAQRTDMIEAILGEFGE